MQNTSKEIVAGVIFTAIGLFFGIVAYHSLLLGTLFRMGPGFMPLVLSSIMVALGLTIAGKGLLTDAEPMETFISWRSALAVLGAPLAFTFTVSPFGFAPAVALGSFIACLAARNMGWRTIAATVLGLTAFCVAVFRYGVRLPLPLLGTFFAG